MSGPQAGFGFSPRRVSLSRSLFKDMGMGMGVLLSSITRFDVSLRSAVREISARLFLRFAEGADADTSSADLTADQKRVDHRQGVVMSC